MTSPPPSRRAGWQEPTAESKVAECVPEEERPLLERLAAAAQLHDDLKSRARPSDAPPLGEHLQDTFRTRPGRVP